MTPQKPIDWADICLRAIDIVEKRHLTRLRAGENIPKKGYEKFGEKEVTKEIKRMLKENEIQINLQKVDFKDKSKS